MDPARARNHRRKRGAALTAVAEGRLPVRKTILDGHNALGTCPIYRLLKAAPGLGPSGVRKVLEHAHVWPLTPLDNLSILQRKAILHELPQRIK